MQNKKVTMLAAVLAVTIIAMAGVGYAAISNYTATTSNTDNSLETTYVVLKQSNVAENPKAAYAENFLTKLYYNTVTLADDESETGDAVYYTPRYTGNLNTETGAYDPNAAEKPAQPVEGETYANAALVSNKLVLTIDPSKAVEATKGTLTVEIDTELNEAAFDYYMVLTNNNTTRIAPAVEGVWTFGQIPLTQTDFTVQLYVMLKNGVTSLKDTSLTGLGDDGSEAIFKFVYTVPVA